MTAAAFPLVLPIDGALARDWCYVDTIAIDPVLGSAIKRYVVIEIYVRETTPVMKAMERAYGPPSPSLILDALDQGGLA